MNVLGYLTMLGQNKQSEDVTVGIKKKIMMSHYISDCYF